MRLQRVRRRTHEIRRAILSRRNPLHHLRSRGRIPLPMGDHIRWSRMVRLLVDDDFPGRPHDRLRLRMEKGSARMGLIANSQSRVIAPQPEDAIDPATGKRVGDTDPFFANVRDELADKGFIVTSTEDLITWARTGSLMWMTFGLACCAEIGRASCRERV